MSEDQQQGLHGLKDTPSETTGGLRSLVVHLLPPTLRQKGFVNAVRELVRRCGEQTDLTYEIENRMTCEPSAAVAAAGYRILQEALRNVRKHASARHVTVALASDARGHNVSVRDDGEGFEPSSALGPREGHLGLSLMRERAEVFGGWLNVLSEPGSGTTVLFWLPSVALS